MKALSLNQPWGFLLLNGFKDIENRTWKTNYRGRFLIHVGLKYNGNMDVPKFAQEIIYKLTGNDISIDILRKMPGQNFGGTIGSIELIDCIINANSVWAFDNSYHWIVSNPEVMEFKSCKGQLNFFEPKYNLLDINKK